MRSGSQLSCIQLCSCEYHPVTIFPQSTIAVVRRILQRMLAFAHRSASPDFTIIGPIAETISAAAVPTSSLQLSLTIVPLQLHVLPLRAPTIISRLNAHDNRTD